MTEFICSRNLCLVKPKIFLKIFIGILIYHVVLVSGVQQSESVIHIHIPTLLFFFLDFFPT